MKGLRGKIVNVTICCYSQITIVLPSSADPRARYSGASPTFSSSLSFDRTGISTTPPPSLLLPLALVFQHFLLGAAPHSPAPSIYPTLLSLPLISPLAREITQPVNNPSWCLSRFRAASSPGRPHAHRIYRSLARAR